MRITVVGTRDRSESLLSSCIPNLELENAISDSYGFQFKVYANSRNIRLIVVVLNKAKHERGLACSWSSNDYNFNEMIILA